MLGVRILLKTPAKIHTSRAWCFALCLIGAGLLLESPSMAQVPLDSMSIVELGPLTPDPLDATFGVDMNDIGQVKVVGDRGIDKRDR